MRSARARRRGPTRSAHGPRVCSGCGVTPHRPRPARRPPPSRVIDNVFGFAEELLAAQRDFAKRLVQATAPAADAAQSRGKSTTKKATS
jgi:radical SAM superfamily enzyme YgiQ (UPF0313 family)